MGDADADDISGWPDWPALSLIFSTVHPELYYYLSEGDLMCLSLIMYIRCIFSTRLFSPYLGVQGRR